MPEFTRLTIIGTERKAELVVPSDEAIGRLMPRLMELLEEPNGSVARPLTLVRATGEQLDVAMTAADQSLLDGELLRIVRADDAPPPPEVADVTDVLGESLRDRAGLWSRQGREVTGAIALGVLAVVITLLTPAGILLLTGVYFVLVVGAAVAGRLGWRWGSVALTAMALGVVLAGCWPTSTRADLGALAVPTALTIATILGWLALRFGIGIGLNTRPVMLGSYLGVGLAAVPVLLILVGVPAEGAVAIAAAVAVIACGVLPRVALASSGLTGLDDQVLEGHPRRRDDVELTVNDAYRMLSWAAVAVAIPLAVAPALLLASTNPWAVAAGALAVVITALRTRAFPLTVQQMALWAAVLVATIAGLLRQPRLDDLVVAILLAAVAVLVVILVMARPAAHARAFWRRAGNLVEALAVIALIPVLLGVFGVYADLLGSFR
jgi:type VII secretion integral membrane protein EccD